MDKKVFIECDSCGFRFQLINSLVKEADVEIKGKKFKLTYLYCPKCDAIYKISLKDKEFIDLEDDLNFAINNLSKAQGCKDIYKIQVLQEVVGARKVKLRNKFIALQKAYKGHFEIKRSTDELGNVNESIVYRK